ncbi:MAG: hypothetical protein ABFD82_18460 [Syntrophaceae bacterium]
MLDLKDLSPEERDFYEERAAILEYDANLTRREAERVAMVEVEKKRELF